MNVIAQEWSMRFASWWMCSCSCGETLSASVQRNTRQRKSVGEDNISHQSIRMIVSEIERGINLKVRRDVPSESNRRGILPAALEIDLHPPLLIKIISVTENRFVFAT